MLDDLNEFLDQDPFVPFRITLTSGDRYDVATPLQVVLGPSRMTFYYPASDRRAVFRLNQIVALETLQD